jgi:hypothetical protein
MLGTLAWLGSGCVASEISSAEGSTHRADDSVPEGYGWDGFNAPMSLRAPFLKEAQDPKVTGPQLFRPFLESYRTTCRRSGGRFVGGQQFEIEPDPDDRPVFWVSTQVVCELVDPAQLEGILIRRAPRRTVFDVPRNLVLQVYRYAEAERRERYRARVDPHEPVSNMDSGYLVSDQPFYVRASHRAKIKDAVVLNLIVRRASDDANVSSQYEATWWNGIGYLEPKAGATELPPPPVNYAEAPAPSDFVVIDGERYLTAKSWAGFDAPVWLSEGLPGNRERKMSGLVAEQNQICSELGGRLELDSAFERHCFGGEREGLCPYRVKLHCSATPGAVDGIRVQYTELAGPVYLAASERIQVQLFQDVPRLRGRWFGADASPYQPLMMGDGDSGRVRERRGYRLVVEPTVSWRPLSVQPVAYGATGEFLVIVRDAKTKANVSSQFRVEQRGHFLHIVRKTL